MGLMGFDWIRSNSIIWDWIGLDRPLASGGRQMSKVYFVFEKELGGTNSMRSNKHARWSACFIRFGYAGFSNKNVNFYLLQQQKN